MTPAIACRFRMQFHRQLRARFVHESGINLLLLTLEPVTDCWNQAARRRTTLFVHDELNLEVAIFGHRDPRNLRNRKIRNVITLGEVLGFSFPQNDGRPVDSVHVMTVGITRRIELGASSETAAYIWSECWNAGSHVTGAALHVTIWIYRHIDTDVDECVLLHSFVRPIVDA